MLRFLEKVDDFSHKPDFNYYEVWAKLVVKHLYEMSAVSPYRYLKFDMNTGLGGQRFYFRGNSRQNILKSFKYHFRRTHHLKHLMKNNLNDWIFRFTKLALILVLCEVIDILLIMQLSLMIVHLSD